MRLTAYLCTSRRGIYYFRFPAPVPLIQFIFMADFPDVSRIVQDVVERTARERSSAGDTPMPVGPSLADGDLEFH